MNDLNLLFKIIEFLPCAFGDLGWNTTGITVISSPPNMGASGVFVGLDGTLYSVDENSNFVVWKLLNNAVNVTIAAGLYQSQGSNSSQLNYPNDIYVDKSGNIYVSDSSNQRIQKFSNGSNIGVTIAGVTGAASSALNQFNTPRYFTFDATETYMYIADYNCHRIIRHSTNETSGTNGVIITGGTGQYNQNTSLNGPWGIHYLPSISNDLFITNNGGHSVIRWTLGATSGTFVAGTPGVSGSNSTLLNQPMGIKIDSYLNMFIVDSGNHRVQMFCANNQTGITIVGTGVAGSSAMQLNGPRGIVFDSAMNMYIGDFNNHRVQKFIKLNTAATSTTNFTSAWNSTGITVAGDAGGSSGTAANRFNGPYVLRFDSSNALIISDTINNRIQKWIIGNSSGTTIAGQANGTAGASATSLFQPVGIALDSSDSIYVADKSNNRIMFWANGASSGSMIAGTGSSGNASNQFSNPNMIERVSSSGTLYITDVVNHRVMQYLNGSSSGTVVAGGNGFGTNTSQLWFPFGFTLDLSTNSLIIANYAAHNIVRWVIGATSWTLLAGSATGASGSSSTLLYNPIGVALDQYHNLYVADAANHRIQFFLAGQFTATTIAGISGSSALVNPPAIIQWLFNSDFNDVYGTYNGSLVNNSNVTWMSPGYAGYGSAVCFLSTNYLLINHYLNFNSTSFTISAWIWIPANLSLNENFFVLFVHCNLTTQDTCLHIGIDCGRVFLGFYSDDLTGGTSLNSSQWYHVAYVYDRLSSRQIVYLKEIQDGRRVTSGPYKGTANVLTVGSIPSFAPGFITNNGFIDKLTFVPRVKTTAELLDEATLVACYTFDNSYTDLGPNQIINSTSVSTMFDSSGRFNQSLLINSTNLSYFQTTSFYYLGQTNYPYSFSLWIYPFVNDGTILQVSSLNGWCVPMIGFDISGRLTIQTMGSNGIYAASLTSDTLSLNQWTHVAMTYSIIIGIQLFINEVFVVGNNTVTSYSASDQISTITIGTCLSPSTCAVNTTTIIPSQFQGKIDELKIFSRELSLSDIDQLAQATSLYTFGPSSFWQFDNNTLDSISNLNGVAITSPTYVTPGITGSGYAINLIKNNTQYVTIAANQIFANTSFTVEMWIYPTLLSDIFYGLFSQHGASATDCLLYLILRYQLLYMGFFSDDLQGTTAVSVSYTWYHVTFVYDYRSRTQIVYLNGYQDGLRSPAGPYLGISGAINIGTFLDSANITQPYNIYIDQVSLTMRVKSASEILTDATLTTWHSFDSIPLQDSGPLGLITTTNNVTLATGKIQSFVLLGISNHSYSIALCVKRTSTGGGTLVHLSTQTNGQGWCVTLLGFRSTGEIVATNWASSGKEVVGPVLPINIWTHVASTFSTMNGLRFYINGIYSAGTGVMNYGAAQQTVILTLGNPIAGGSCNSMSIKTGIYSGYFDEFRVYSRELSVADVYTLANP
ncbi:unnamed protein product [Adineta steineri]|uniref:Uncharacterized protein n=1 Tax=Adineta steineri TaxID=433720 RepID=A0A819ES68_9BILA|nr:unnamed protein product [Adineta steineri]CAF3856199.1 unnamed protein product [Adineta steineri]CAF3887702.1 unnamed protein product [Adineta steineri]